MSNSVTNNTTISGITEATGRTGTTTAGRRHDVAGRARTRGGDRGQGRSSNNRPVRTNFKGDTEGMNANVFQCYEEQTDRRQFSKTIEALEAYTKKNLKFAEDLAPLSPKKWNNQNSNYPPNSLPNTLPLSKQSGTKNSGNSSREGCFQRKPGHCTRGCIWAMQ
jgi:hypothetical protein